MNAPAPAMKPEHMDFIVWYLFSVRGQFTLAFSDYETINLAMGFEPGWKPELIASMRRLAERGCLRITPCIETRDEVVTDATPIHTRVLVSHPDNADSIRRRLDGDYWLQEGMDEVPVSAACSLPLSAAGQSEGHALVRNACQDCGTAGRHGAGCDRRAGHRQGRCREKTGRRIGKDGVRTTTRNRPALVWVGLNEKESIHEKNSFHE